MNSEIITEAPQTDFDITRQIPEQPNKTHQSTIDRYTIFDLKQLVSLQILSPKIYTHSVTDNVHIRRTSYARFSVTDAKGDGPYQFFRIIKRQVEGCLSHNIHTHIFRRRKDALPKMGCDRMQFSARVFPRSAR